MTSDRYIPEEVRHVIGADKMALRVFEEAMQGCLIWQQKLPCTDDLQSPEAGRERMGFCLTLLLAIYFDEAEPFFWDIKIGEAADVNHQQDCVRS